VVAWLPPKTHIGYFEIECVMAVHPRSLIPRFKDIAGFLLKTAIPPQFYPNFGVFTLYKIADVGPPGSEDHL